MEISSASTAHPRPQTERLKLKVKASLDDRKRELIQRRLEKLPWVTRVYLFDLPATFVVEHTSQPDAGSILINALITIGYNDERA